MGGLGSRRLQKRTNAGPGKPSRYGNDSSTPSGKHGARGGGGDDLIEVPAVGGRGPAVAKERAVSALLARLARVMRPHLSPEAFRCSRDWLLCAFVRQLICVRLFHSFFLWVL